MLRNAGVLALLTVLFGWPVCAQDWARKMFKETAHDFGTVARRAKAEYAFALYNPYVENVHIVGVRSSCSCTRPRVESRLLKTYEHGAVIAAIDTDSFVGRKGATITVTLDKPFPAEVQLHVKTNICDNLELVPGSVQLGSVKEGQPVQRKITVRHTGRYAWQIRKVESTNPHITATFAPTGGLGRSGSYDLRVRLDENAPVGYVKDHLMLITNDRWNAQIPVPVEGRVLPALTVSPASLFMGVVEPGQKVTKQLIVRGTKPFRILSIRCDDDSFEFETADSLDDPKRLHVIPVTFFAGQDAGKVTKTIRIETDQATALPELAAYAVVSIP